MTLLTADDVERAAANLEQEAAGLEQEAHSLVQVARMLRLLLAERTTLLDILRDCGYPEPPGWR